MMLSGIDRGFLLEAMWIVSILSMLLFPFRVACALDLFVFQLLFFKLCDFCYFVHAFVWGSVAVVHNVKRRMIFAKTLRLRSHKCFYHQ